MSTTRTAASSLVNESDESQARMSILIADKLEAVGVDGLKKLSPDVTHNADVSADALPALVEQLDPDILIVRGKKVKADVFAKAKKLSLVIRGGAGYDTIDVATASSRGVFVANCPGKNAIAVAELVWGLILGTDRRIPDQTIDLRAGKWNKKEFSKANGLYGRTLGIVGMGQIGQEVAARGKAFGMNVVAWSRSLTEAAADAMEVDYCSNLINLAKMSDVISVNVAATDETKHLINEQFLSAMRQGAMLVNTSRGSVVDEAALAKAVKERGIRTGLDVFDPEPSGGEGTISNPILQLPGVYGTHHIGASTDQAQLAIAREVIRIASTYMETGEVMNCVNLALTTPATTLITVRHLNVPGVLAHIFYILSQARINVEDMQNIVYEGGKAACARIQLDDAPAAEHLKTIANNENILSVNLSRIPNRKR
ncbi:MAG TPA: 3-phosphoglycerate dehydrogenase family protein [Phycisphaerales bacterium]|nr:3-phosphoglycerate dehydrogenase family protein [Phycisphaerales bacterium]